MFLSLFILFIDFVFLNIVQYISKDIYFYPFRFKSPQHGNSPLDISNNLINVFHMLLPFLLFVKFFFLDDIKLALKIV